MRSLVHHRFAYGDGSCLIGHYAERNSSQYTKYDQHDQSCAAGAGFCGVAEFPGTYVQPINQSL